ncbi:RagB/SusD family nutrient uptake outer membrane protein [Chitinophaga oryzae]|uniref:RagB/SusD family nutrient uptake outer membrane protein n=1 Tax=Chitinophaga oryzae TaxID=2725414 RepID=A0AAE7D9Q1_9BACT|nr:RagB/SusD family nutrient uptake outer membrane protein [Chitinophaga oryzae]QJB35101.1 RagB/SusD family nutrient uptake outer membrane protein [Chitinophaga oryzae]QJB41618.1 RagB/SusD family nutrient uptake outer membrane protein [Chitinophaga oryzae]
MKTLRYTSGILLVAALLGSGCGKSFLEKPAYSSLSEEIVANKDGVNYLLVGAYAALDGAGAPTASLGGGNAWEAAATNWVYGSVAGGDAHKGSEGTDQTPINEIAIWQPNVANSFFNTKWRAVYEGVARCNNTLRLMAQAKDMSDADKTKVEAEARFLRGHYYFELKKMFNKVPYITETTADPVIPNEGDIWPNIEADFKYAQANLPPTQPQVARANKWAAQIYLAKTYLYQKKYAEALPLFKDAIASGVTSNGLKYKLTDNFEDNFDASKKNNSESVFAIQMSANDGTNGIANANMGDMLNFPANFKCCGFYQPSFDLVNSYRVDANGLPYLDDYNQHPVKSDMGIRSTQPFTPDAGPVDPRLDWTVGRRGVPYHDWGYFAGSSWIRDQTQRYAGPYATKKMVYWNYNKDKYMDNNSWAPGSAINVLLIRFSDVLLMAAECAAETGDLGTALTYVNTVRSRMKDHPEGWVHDYKDPANPIQGFDPNKPLPYYKIGLYTAFGDVNFARKAIRFERKLELAMEGHRFFDISRWGIADQVMNAYFAFESAITDDVKGGHFTKGRNEYFPVPQRQIDLTLKNGQPVLKQNTGY